MAEPGRYGGDLGVQERREHGAAHGVKGSGEAVGAVDFVVGVGEIRIRNDVAVADEEPAEDVFGGDGGGAFGEAIVEVDDAAVLLG